MSIILSHVYTCTKHAYLDRSFSSFCLPDRLGSCPHVCLAHNHPSTHTHTRTHKQTPPSPFPPHPSNPPPEVIESFVGIRIKCYTFKTKNNVVKKAKGDNKVVVKKNISFDDYKKCVLKTEPKNVKINAIRTVKMMNYSLTQNKLV